MDCLLISVMRKFLMPILVLIFFSHSFEALALSQNDVSILIPLPQNANEDVLFRVQTQGAFGELLPAFVLGKMPALVFEEAKETFKRLRVISIRLDPCFPLASPQTGCQPQVRMIWQPLVENTDGSLRTLDAALHSFYDLTNEEFALLISQIENLKNQMGEKSSDEILTVHPLLKKYGLRSSYAQSLFSILLSHVGASRLSQATFMQLAGAENMWNFGAFTISGSQISRTIVPRTQKPIQVFRNSPITPDYFGHGGMFPAPQGADTFNLLVTESKLIEQKDESEVIEGVMSATRIENPNNHNPHTVDCASCHTAQMARIWANNQFPWLMLESRAEQFRFQSKFNLLNSSPQPGNTKVLRAFGYINSEPAISQRTINETARVLESLRLLR